MPANTGRWAERGTALGSPKGRCPLGWVMPSTAAASSSLRDAVCSSLISRLGAVTPPLAPGASVAAGPLSKSDTRERLTWKSSRLLAPFAAAAHAGLFLPGEGGGKKRG